MSFILENGDDIYSNFTQTASSIDHEITAQDTKPPFLNHRVDDTWFPNISGCTWHLLEENKVVINALQTEPARPPKL